jgi:hypothetical protein
MKKIILLLLSLNFLFCTSYIAYSQEEDDEEMEKIKEIETKEKKKVKYEKRTKIDFSDTYIMGELKKPTGFLIFKRTGVQFKELIKIRKNFDKKLHDSIFLIDKK